MINVTRKRGYKTICSMTVTAFSVGGYMTFIFPYGYTAMACGTCPINRAMIKAAVILQFNETRGIVTFITFSSRRGVKFGFTDSQYVVMTLAAITSDFQVVYIGGR
jgi:hypothetical protein